MMNIFRNFHGQSDYPKMAQLVQEIAVADHIEHWSTAEDLERDYQHLVNSNPETDMCMVENEDGKLVAYARVFWMKDENERQVFSFPFNIHPDYRTPELNQALLRWVEKRCAELASGDQPLLRAMLHKADKNREFQQALEMEGFQAVRFNFRMNRDLNDPIDIPRMPEGLEVRPVPEAQYRAVFDAANEAFRDHWGYTAMPEEAYQQYLASLIFKPELWQVAWDGDQVAGAVLNFIDQAANEQFKLKLGWTDPIFTRRPWRKRGLARALLMRSLQLLKDCGMTQAALSVDTENPSGALGFYESCGFKMEYQSIFYEKDVPTGEG
jgi:mycothiol synthase